MSGRYGVFFGGGRFFFPLGVGAARDEKGGMEGLRVIS